MERGSFVLFCFVFQEGRALRTLTHRGGLAEENLSFRRKGVNLRKERFFRRWEGYRMAFPRVGLALEGRGRGTQMFGIGELRNFISPCFGGGKKGGCSVVGRGREDLWSRARVPTCCSGLKNYS